MRKESFKSQRAGNIKTTFRGYLAFIPNPLPPELAFDLEMIKSLSEADHALGELAGVGRMLPNPYYLVGPAIRREAVMSSRVEGTQTGMSDLFFFEANPEAPPRHEMKWRPFWV